MSPRIGFVSTYQPTNCGIATFSASLMSAINTMSAYSTKIVRLVEKESDIRVMTPEVIATIIAGNSSSITRAATELNKMDVVMIQHEFGIYGGEDGVEVISLMNKLRVPAIVVLHTVLSSPTRGQRAIIKGICERAAAIVVMSKIAVDRLIAEVDIDADKIFLVQHGARRNDVQATKNKGERPIVLSWGLISPGKGVEWVIRAMDLLRDLSPAPLYIVSGRTHPKVIENQGESYRESLQSLIAELDLGDSVELRPTFLENDDLDRLLASSAMVVLPYDNSEQVTSGVLMEAVSAGRPIVATRFPHAVELLEDNVGILVPYRDATAIANAIRRVLMVPEVAEEMSYRTKVIAKGIQWPVIARQYVQIASRLMYSRVSA